MSKKGPIQMRQRRTRLATEAAQRTKKCPECGTLIHPALALCHSCTFWMEKVYWAEDGDQTEDGHRVLRIDGRHYVSETEQCQCPDPRFTACPHGFGGQNRAYILLDDETEFEFNATNVWFQGQIPEVFRDRLPDNAKFVHPYAVKHPWSENDG